MSTAPIESITLHSSWRGVIANVVGALCVLGGGVLAVSMAGWRVLPIIVLVVGIGACVIVAFDYPVATTFTADGSTRHTLLRRHHLDWNRVGQLSRSRPGISAGVRQLAHGGLVALVGRRRYLLVDHCESLDEFEALEQLLVDRPELIDSIPRPIASVPPTWLYRREKWAPSGTRHGR